MYILFDIILLTFAVIFIFPVSCDKKHTQKIKEKGAQQKQYLRCQIHSLVAHEFKCRRYVVHGEYQKNMYQHI